MDPNDVIHLLAVAGSQQDEIGLRQIERNELLAALRIAKHKIEILVPAATGGLPAEGDADYQVICNAITKAESES